MTREEHRTAEPFVFDFVDKVGYNRSVGQYNEFQGVVMKATATNELEEKYTDVLEASARLGIHPESARRLIREGRIPGAFKFGNKWLIERDKLEQFARTYNGRPGPKATLI